MTLLSLSCLTSPEAPDALEATPMPSVEESPEERLMKLRSPAPVCGLSSDILTDTAALRFCTCPGMGSGVGVGVFRGLGVGREYTKDSRNSLSGGARIYAAFVA